MAWWEIGSLVISSILVFLFIVGGFFMTRSFLKKMKKD